MLRTEKEASVSDIRATFARMSSAVFVDYAGMTVAEISNLRSKFRAQGVEYRVFKNTLVKKALAGEKFVDALAKTALRGMTGVALSFEEPSAAARVVKDFVKENEKLKVKAGLLEGEVLSAKAVEEQLATLPNKDEMRARLLATLNAPAQRFVMLMNAPARELVGVLDAKRRKDAGE